MNRIFNILQYLSIDVVLGSAGSSVLASNVLSVKPSTGYWLIMPMCVWVIYTADHLLDGIKMKKKATLERHYFHFKYRKILSAVLSLTVLTILILSFKLLTRQMIDFGFILIILIGVYLMVNYYANRIFIYIPRECFIAIGYICGTWGIPIIMKYPFLKLTDLLLFTCHFLIVLSIPVLQSIYEYKADKSAGFISYATTYGINGAGLLVQRLLILALGLSILSLLLYQENAGIILIWMNIVLLTVLAFRKKITLNNNYRWISDATNFLPFILLINI